ncbi:MAG: STAS domain-containing protein [Synergistaceae bacterium]|nr:STAS domain-containing protein [Synergistaceae bacterium]
MNIRAHIESSTLTVLPEGRLDTSAAPQLEEELKAHLEGVRELIMDLGGAEYISSAGLRVLLSAHKAMKKNNGSMKIINANSAVMDVLEVTGFSGILNIQQ